MENQKHRAKVVLLGLESSLAAELGRVLTKQEQAVYAAPFQSAPENVGFVGRIGADVIFCPADRRQYLELLATLNQNNLELPVIVVSRTPEVSEWLDAIEAGASDYCAAPFESSHIQWILDSTLHRQSTPVLYRTAS